MDRKYVVVDLEATGPHYEAGDAIIQIGLTILEQRQISQTLTIDINPERMIPPHITELTGISNEAVAQAPLFRSGRLCDVAIGRCGVCGASGSV